MELCSQLELDSQLWKNSRSAMNFPALPAAARTDGPKLPCGLPGGLSSVRCDRTTVGPRGTRGLRLPLRCYVAKNVAWSRTANQALPPPDLLPRHPLATPDFVQARRIRLGGPHAPRALSPRSAQSASTPQRRHMLLEFRVKLPATCIRLRIRIPCTARTKGTQRRELKAE